MSLPSRIFLLFAAAFCGGYFTLLVVGFSYGAATSLYAAAAATILLAPLWFPALMPAKLPKLQRISCRVGALALAIPVCLFIYGAAKDFIGSFTDTSTDKDFIAEALIQIALASLFMACIFVLLWPEIRAKNRAE